MWSIVFRIFRIILLRIGSENNVMYIIHFHLDKLTDRPELQMNYTSKNRNNCDAK